MIPRPLLRIAVEWWDKMILHLNQLTEDIRHGIISAVTRTIGESVEGMMHSVFQSADPILAKENLSNPNDLLLSKNSEKVFEDECSFKNSDEGWLVNEDRTDLTSSMHHHTSIPCDNAIAIQPPRQTFWRFVFVTSLTGLMTWLGVKGLTSLGTASSVLTSAIALILR